MMAQASVFLPGETGACVLIRRGMTVTCDEGREAGQVAGVAISQASRQALCLILGHLPAEGGYQSVPLSWIERVSGDVIFLKVRLEKVLALPDWHFH
jgi:hypothetical protein